MVAMSRVRVIHYTVGVFLTGNLWSISNNDLYSYRSKTYNQKFIFID